IAVHFQADGDLLRNVDLSVSNAFSCSFEGTSSSLKKTLSDWIEAYLAAKPMKLEIDRIFPVSWQNPFQQKIAEGLLSIPFGSTLSYSELARKIGAPKAARAAGNACGRNPIPLLVPCHRIIQQNGKLGGFTAGLEIKKQLLLFERQHNGIF
ncbi:MAG TPA: methylated-DNA--[protein]-cysteine S-methyltransferase, partial [Chlamydiales bacterium]|nr:methylated-DNA--[protein]-cysteine S-methyltransferase [Chlamydiales bacterium]